MFIKLHKKLPGLRGQDYYPVRADIDILEGILIQNGFTVFRMDGLQILGEQSFFYEICRALNIPYQGMNSWSAIESGLEKFIFHLRDETEIKSVAILWKDADKTYSVDTNTFLEAIFVLKYAAVFQAVLRDEHFRPVELGSIQFAIFLLGESTGFTKIRFNLAI
jgi:hypothetical protein